MSSPAPDKHRFVIVPHRPYARALLVVAAVLWLASLVAAWWMASERAAPGMSKLRQELELASKRATEAEARLIATRGSREARHRWLVHGRHEFALLRNHGT